MAGELAAESAAGEDRQLPFLAAVRLPEVCVGDGRGAPRSGLSGSSSMASRSASVTLEEVADRPADPGRWWTPLVMPRISRGVALPGAVGRLAVELATALAPW